MDTERNDSTANSGDATDLAAAGDRGDDPADRLNDNEHHRRVGAAEESGILQLLRKATRRSEKQHQPKSLKEILLYGWLGVAQIVGQLYLPMLNSALDEPVEYVGWVRLCVFLGGCYCLLLAWPSRKISSIEAAERAERTAAKAEFHEKIDRW